MIRVIASMIVGVLQLGLQQFGTCQKEMGWEWLSRELRLSNSCYMAAAIEFNYAMFHIFSGPLFANLEGYVFLDLLIWGVSPLLFELCRTPLRHNIQPLRSGTSGSQRKVVGRRTGWLMVCFLSIAVSYLFMNYSQTFRWNYFSRIVNLDFGYLLFDLACRCMEFIVEIEEEEQQKQLEKEGAMQEPKAHRFGYCKYRNVMMMASYFLVFYLSTNHDPNDLESGKLIFKTLSAFSTFMTLAIPVLYLFRHRSSSYGPLANNEDLEVDLPHLSPEEPSPWEWNNQTYLAYGLVSFSFFVNTSYFSMWIMEGLKSDGQQPYQQFNKALFFSSAVFLAASFIQFVAAHSFFGLKGGDETSQGNYHRYVGPFLIGYGVLMGCMFAFWKEIQWHHMAIPILPFGFHYVLVNYLTEMVAERKERNLALPGHHRIFFICESIAYLIVPAILTIVGQADSALVVFGYLSAASLVAGGWLLRSE